VKLTRKKYPDLTNEKFGRLTVMYRAPNYRGHVAYQCECSCGAFPIVRASSLLSTDTGRGTRSCGCLRREKAIQKIEGGVCARVSTHGCATRAGKPKEYRAWASARNRYKNIPDFSWFYRLTGPAFPGTRLRRLSDGRFEWRRGEKLSMKLAREIRTQAAQGKTQRQIAKEFEIGKTVVSDVIRNKVWQEAA
jgi:hypothetical protein